MKSTSIRDNHDRRLRILHDIAKLPISFCTLAANKDAIRRKSGLVYKDPFLKFLHGQLFSRLYRSISSLAVVCDEHGDDAFMRSFSRYVRKRHVRDLFNQQTFEFRSSKDDPLSQVADVISGSLARHFDAEKATDRSKEFLEALRPITIDVAEWPVIYRHAPRISTLRADDSAVEASALDQAGRFLAEHQETEDDQIHARCCLLRYLLYELLFVNRSGYVATKRLQDVLATEHGIIISEHQLRSTIIAPLRDAGLLITSSQKGYKIPVSVGELLDFVDHAHSIVDPLLKRVREARSQVMLSTGGVTDILAGDRYSSLRRLIDA